MTLRLSRSHSRAFMMFGMRALRRGRVHLRRRLARAQRLRTELEMALRWPVLVTMLPLAAILGLGAYSGGALSELHAHVNLAWFALLAVVVTAFSGAYAATEPAPPLAPDKRHSLAQRLGGARLLGLAALFFCVYLESVLSWYVGSSEHSRLAGEATWWGTPLALFFWCLGCLEIAHETEHSGSGAPAEPDRQWAWMARLRMSRPARASAYAFLATGAVSFAVAGVVPGVLWRRAASGEVAPWRGHGYITTPVYNFGFTVWAGIVLAAAALFLAHSFRARPRGLPSAVLRRAWYSLWASAALVILMACFGFAAQGVLAEPIIDVALSLYGLVFAVMLVDASAATRHRRVKSSLPRRTVGATLIVTFTFGVAIIVEPHLGFFRCGLLGLAVATVVPLFPVIHRALYGIERAPVTPEFLRVSPSPDSVAAVPVPIDDAMRQGVYDAMFGNKTASPEPPVEVIAQWQRGLIALRDMELPDGTNVPAKHTLQLLLFTCDDGHERSKRFTPPEQMVVLLEQLFEGNLDEQKFQMIDLMRRGANVLASTKFDSHIHDRHPSAMEMLEAECIARLPTAPEDEAQRWTRLRDMRRAWLTGQVNQWTGDQQDVVILQSHAKQKKNLGDARAKRLVAACETLLEWWVANLEAATETVGAGQGS